VGRISGLIIKKLTTLADPRDQNTHCRKRKALTALFPYAAWQERDKQYPVFDILLRVIKSSKSNRVLWRHVGRFLETQLSETGDVSLNRAMILISPHVPWGELIFEGNLGRAWAATVSAIPKEEEFIPSVVDALLQIARFGPLRGCNSNVWSWLALRPSLPPTCAGRVTGSHPGAVRTIRDLKDIEILKSYLFLVWSKWDFLNDGGFNKICDSIREDFGGVDMRLDRVDLMERLDHVLRQLDRGLYYLQRSKPEITERGLQQSKDQYGKLKKILLEVDRKALETLTRTSSGSIVPYNLLTSVDTHRIPLDVHVCAPSPVSIVDHPEQLGLHPTFSLHPGCYFSSCGPLRGRPRLIADGLLTGHYSWTFYFCDLYDATRFRLIFLILAFAFC